MNMAKNKSKSSSSARSSMRKAHRNTQHSVTMHSVPGAVADNKSIIPSFLTQKLSLKLPKSSKKDTAFVFVLGVEDRTRIENIIEDYTTDWQKTSLLAAKKELLHFVSNQGPVWILCRWPRPTVTSHHGQLEESAYAWARENGGGIFTTLKSYKVSQVIIEMSGTNEEIDLGFLVGMEMSAYTYKSSEKTIADLPDFHLYKTEGSLEPDVLTKAIEQGVAINTARHLVNMPPNILNPKSFTDMVKEIFAKSKSTQVKVWDTDRLIQENMGLHVAVGQGAEHGPAMVHIQYRPSKAQKSKTKKQSVSQVASTSAPLAFVGKGITFDTGGLDIKPSSGMRLMKKDMGGAAALVGLAYWAVSSGYNRALDFYIGLAENVVDQKSFRPSDVVTARNGMQVEIHNTDAEGRLVLADVLDVAVTQKGEDDPEMVIDVATLTGAIKVALGADLAGLFSNSDEVAEQLQLAGQKAGDLNWRMPLYLKYTQGMSSAFADIVNAVDGFGGAITAALFLEKFVRNKPWAHLDIYAWNDKPTGSLGFSGGSGQGVQALIQFIQRLEN